MESQEFAFKYNSYNKDGNANPFIMRELSNIVFPSLKFLNFSYNGIISIEVLSCIEMPLLEELELCIFAIKQLGIIFINSKKFGSFPPET